MISNNLKSVLVSGLTNGLLWSAVLTLVVYLFKGIYKPYLVIAWFLFFFATGMFRKWYTLKNQKD